MALLRYVLFASLCVLITGKEAILKQCRENDVSVCEVTEARIEPCNSDPCNLKRKKNASISFDIVPQFAANNLTTMVYYPEASNDREFTGFGSTNGCEYTKCPTEVGVKQTVNYSLYINKLLPKGEFEIKWKVWNVEEPKQSCCFMTTIAIR